MKKVLIASGIALFAIASIAGAQGYAFNTNLTVGSTGADVVALQTWLIANGYSIPAIASGAASKGYFGAQTQMAVKAYQASKGIPNTGFVGPLTRGALNGGASAPVAVGCPAGYVCTPTAGTPVMPVTPGVISTPGVEGTLSATQSNAGLSSTLYEGDKMASVLGVKLEAKTSDILVQRVKLDLGTDTKIYNKIFSRIYVTDGTTVFASTDLNSSTVVKDSGRYYITLAGFNFLVPKNSSKVLVVKVDVQPTIDSTDIDTETYPVALASSGIRGLDGAGIDQYAGGTSITRTPTIASDLSETATLTLSLNSASPKKTNVVATSGSTEDELDKLTTLIFDLRAEKDNVLLKDINIGVVKSGGGAAVAQTAYLYDGSTEIDSASISGGMASFNDVDIMVNRDSTKTLAVKVDFRDANGTVANFVTQASTTSTHLVGENSKGDGVTESGSATGYQIGMRNAGAEIALTNRSISVTGTNNSGSTLSTSTVTASFDLTVRAKGSDLLFGLSGSTTPAVTFGIYNSANSSVVSTTTTNVAASGIQVTSIVTAMPEGVTQDAANKSFTVTKNNTATMRVSVSFAGKSVAGVVLTDQYSVGIDGVTYRIGGSSVSDTFMAGETSWLSEPKTP